MGNSPRWMREKYQGKHLASVRPRKMPSYKESDTRHKTPPPSQPDVQPPDIQSQDTQPQDKQPAKEENRFLRSLAAKHPCAASVLKKFLFLLVLFTVPLLCLGWDIWALIWQHCRLAPIISGIFLLLELVLQLLGALSDKDDSFGSVIRDLLLGKAHHGESWFESTDRFLKSLKSITQIRMFRTVVVLSAIVMLSSLSAHALCEGFYVQFPGLRHLYETEDSQQVSGQDEDNNSTPDDASGSSTGSLSEPKLSPEEDSKLSPEEGSELSPEEDSELSPEEDSELSPEEDSELSPEEDSKPELFLLDPERRYTLDNKETNDLFFLSGSYTIEDWLSPAMIKEDKPPSESVSYNKITDWDSYSEIAKTIKPFIEDLCSQRESNLFDGIAPQTTCNEIFRASSLQENMINSADLDSIITARSVVWSEYPKFSIANLLANNMQRYAQEYHKVGGAYETKKYYLAQSIFWSFKSLVFSSVDPATRKTTLNYISMRYHDIADMATVGSEDQVRASALSEAFKLLENMEFSSDPASNPEQYPDQIVPTGDKPQLPQK